MPDLCFHILEKGRRDLHVCRLTEKAVEEGRRVHIRVPDERTAADLDGQLWTFRDQSFLPHSIGAPPSEHVHVTIHDQWLPEERDVLINLSDDMLEDFASFKQILEVVGPDDVSKQSGRSRFRQYRDQGLTPEHQIVK